MDIEFKKRFAKAFEKSGCVPKLTMKKLQASSGNHNGKTNINGKTSKAKK